MALEPMFWRNSLHMRSAPGDVPKRGFFDGVFKFFFVNSLLTHFRRRISLLEQVTNGIALDKFVFRPSRDLADVGIGSGKSVSLFLIGNVRFIVVIQIAIGFPLVLLRSILLMVCHNLEGFVDISRLDI